MQESIGERSEKLLFLKQVKVAIRYYGVLADLAGRNTDDPGIREGAVFADLKELLEEKYPDFCKYTFVFFQNANHCPLESTVKKEIEIECMPPFSGG